MLTYGMHLRLFLRSFFLQAGWNFIKYQNLGLAFVMFPFLKKIYKQDKEALPSVVERYLESFNTQPTMASFCIGALAKQEEMLAKAETLPLYQQRLNEWNSLKRSLSITTASIGDRLFWGTLKPFTLLMALCIWLLLDVNFFEITLLPRSSYGEIFGAAIVAFGVFNTMALVVKWQGISLSYHAENNGCFGLTKYDWNKTIYHAKQMGILFSIILLLWGVYYFVHGWEEALGLAFISRAIIVVFFVNISFITRNLRIPNMYVYIIAAMTFSVACLF